MQINFTLSKSNEVHKALNCIHIFFIGVHFENKKRKSKSRVKKFFYLKGVEMEEQNQNINLSVEDISYLRDRLSAQIDSCATGDYMAGSYTESEALQEIAAANSVLSKLY